MIAGQTDFDSDLIALGNIFAEWTSASNYADRVAHLKGDAPGLNGTTLLNATTVHNDSIKDVLVGAKGSDFFVMSALDTADSKSGEQSLSL